MLGKEQLFVEPRWGSGNSGYHLFLQMLNSSGVYSDLFPIRRNDIVIEIGNPNRSGAMKKFNI
jgi:hypothetical protein